MSLDSRGVRRGRCTACNCDSYDGGSDMKKCLQCAHPPGKHENLDRGTSFPAASYHSQAASSQHDFGLHHMLPQHVYVPTQLPQCEADGCQNQVWYDPGLGQALFSYCSPECRDRHLLPIQKQKLKDDLEELKMELQQEVVKEISMTKPSSPKAKACDNSVHSKPPVSKQTQQGRSPQPPTPSTPSTVESGSSSSPTSTKGDYGDEVKPKQKTVVVVIEKDAGRPCGLILSKEPFVTDEKNIELGFVIVGVVKDSKVYRKVQDDLIRMFDVIETVNDKPCGDLRIPETDIQESFEKFIKSKDTINLRLNRSIALPPVSSSLCDARRRYLVYSHILVLRYSEGSSDDYGLTLRDVPGEYVQVTGASKGSPADICRLKFGDKIRMYALASPEGIQSSQSVSSKTLVQVKMDLEKAHRAKKNVILVVQR